jgi:hypothetical protein
MFALNIDVIQAAARLNNVSQVPAVRQRSCQLAYNGGTVIGAHGAARAAYRDEWAIALTLRA